MTVVADQIQYVPPEIKGNVSEEILAKALEEANTADVWKVLVMQSQFTPGAEHQGYTVQAMYGKEGLSREHKLIG